MAGDVEMNILITGNAGFIGNALWDRWKDKYTLIGIDNLSRETSISPIIDSLQPHLFFLEDVNNIDNLPLNLPKLDLIVHLAAQVAVTHSLIDPISDFKTNAEGTLRMCLLAKKHQCKLIYSSTNKVYGELIGVNTPVKDSTPFSPQTPYGISKCCGAQYVLDILPDTGYVFNQSCIYGEKQLGTVDQGWIGWLKNCISKNIPVTCYGDGSQIRDLLHVDDLIDLYELVLNEQIPPGSYVVGGGEENSYSFSEVVRIMGGEISKYENWRSRDQKYFVSSNEKLNCLGWKPKIKFLQ